MRPDGDEYDQGDRLDKVTGLGASALKVNCLMLR